MRLSGAKLITNFAGPMNNFILGVVVFWILIFMQGGVRDTQTNNFSIIPNSALAKVGVENTAQITKVGSHEISNWQDLIQAVEAETKAKQRLFWMWPFLKMGLKNKSVWHLRKAKGVIF